MMDAEQVLRKSRPVDIEEVARTDLRNRERLKAIIRSHGWPTLAMVGADGSQAAWIIAQHADADPQFQRDVLVLLEPLVESKQVDARWYAYLHDRVHVPQRFGTQGGCRAKGVWAPREIESPAQVDERRASVGLDKLSEYVEFASSRLCAR